MSSIYNYDCQNLLNEYSKYNNKKLGSLDVILIPTLGMLSLMFFVEAALLLKLPYILRRFYICGSLSKKEKLENKVTIVRGVPGSGKKYYAYNCEKYLDGKFAICNWNDYFTDDDGYYKFNGAELGKAEQYSRLKFIRAIGDKIKRIYVIGNFNEEWMYYEYEKLAKISGYQVEVVDIECVDHKHLKHFNNRSTHNTPFIKSRKCYNNWEYNEENTRQEPYIEYFPGDSIPNYGVITRSKLNKQLEDYKNNIVDPECLIQSESDNEESDEREFSDTFIELIDNLEVDEILQREFYNGY